MYCLQFPWKHKWAPWGKYKSRGPFILKSCVWQVSKCFMLHVTHFEGGLRAFLSSEVKLNMEAEQKGDLSLDVAFRYESDSQLWRLIMEAVSQRTFQGSPGSSPTVPSQIDAGAALKDCSLVQSLGTEIEAHPWQSNGDMTHHRRIIWREGRWKTQGSYSINLVYWKFWMSTNVEKQCTVKQEAPSWLAFIFTTLPFVLL